MARPIVLTAGLDFGESARWHDGRFWYTDWAQQSVVAVDHDGTKTIVVRIPTTRPEKHLPGFGGGGEGPYSIDWLPDGRMLIVSGRDCALLRRESDGRLVPHAEISTVGVSALNEIVVDGRGHIYLDYTGFDFVAGEPFAPGGVIHVSPGGKLSHVTSGMALPNGMAVLADNATLLVADSYGKKLVAFDIDDDGSLSNERTWAELGDGIPDGICVDSEGAVWYADVPNRRCVRVREGGEVLATVEADSGCFSCALGGPDGDTLFVVATRWEGFERAAELVGAGKVLMAEAPAPRTGWP